MITPLAVGRMVADPMRTAVIISFIYICCSPVVVFYAVRASYIYYFEY
jgi:hypothetical protein